MVPSAQASATLSRARVSCDRVKRMTATLPIHAVLPDLLAALRAGSGAVLVAPPGAGKTTAVAPALLAEPWCAGEVVLLSPRRLAARAAAERMAAIAGEPVGRTFGYRTRLESRVSAATRVTVVTEGIFVARIQADPELAGVAAVLFDEVHERSLDGDTALAFALDVQEALRPDLRLLAMSATLDGARFAELMAPGRAGGVPVIESEGRSHPLTLRHLGRAAAVRVEDAVAAAVRRALAEEAGGVLAFLPGVAEIERVAERLDPVPDGVRLHRLHGQLDPQAQRVAERAGGVRQPREQVGTLVGGGPQHLAGTGEHVGLEDRLVGQPVAERRGLDPETDHGAAEGDRLELGDDQWREAMSQRRVEQVLVRGHAADVGRARLDVDAQDMVQPADVEPGSGGRGARAEQVGRPLGQPDPRSRRHRSQLGGELPHAYVVGEALGRRPPGHICHEQHPKARMILSLSWRRCRAD